MHRQRNTVKVTDWSKVDVEKLRRWFGDVSKCPSEFMDEFGVSYDKIYTHRKKLQLPPRPMVFREPVSDPTPEEIAERAADCRRRHYEQVRRYGHPEPQPSKIMCEEDTPDLTPRIFCGGML